MRIAKFISHSGYCSRRVADKLVYDKKVKINSITCDSYSTQVTLNDVVEVEGKTLKLNNKIRLWRFYKPRFISVAKG